MMTSSNGNIFRVTNPLWAKSTGHRWIPSQRPVTRSFGVFFDMRLNKRLNKQSKSRLFETPSRSLWRHCNALPTFSSNYTFCITYHLLLRRLPDSVGKKALCVYMRSEVSLVLKQGRFTISCLWKRGCGTQEAGQQAFMVSQLLGDPPPPL